MLPDIRYNCSTSSSDGKYICSARTKDLETFDAVKDRVAADTELAGYPATFFPDMIKKSRISGATLVQDITE